LQVSTGVSVAYFSSIVLLGLAAAQPASPTGVGDTTTYFDSVVLLTMFLLAGLFISNSIPYQLVTTCFVQDVAWKLTARCAPLMPLQLWAHFVLPKLSF
jgi:hypothetical protein